MAVQGVGPLVNANMLNEIQRDVLTTLFVDSAVHRSEKVRSRADLRARQVEDLTKQGAFIVFFNYISSCIQVVFSDVWRFFSGAEKAGDGISNEIANAIESLEVALNIQKAATMTLGNGRMEAAAPLAYDVLDGLEKLPLAIDTAVDKLLRATHGDITRVREVLNSLASAASCPADKMNFNRLIASFVEKRAQFVVEKEVARLYFTPNEDQLYETYVKALEENSYGLPSPKTGEMKLLNRNDDASYFYALFKSINLSSIRKDAETYIDLFQPFRDLEFFEEIAEDSTEILEETYLHF